MYRLQFPSDGSVVGQWLDYGQALDEQKAYNCNSEIQVYCPDYGIWVKVGG